MSHQTATYRDLITTRLSWLTYPPQHILVAIALAAVTTVLGSPELARWLAVPVFLALAITDIRTRRIQNWIWPPMYAFGLTILGIEVAIRWPLSDLYMLWIGIQLGIGFGIIVPLFYLFWKVLGFGGADFKAVLAVACVFPLLSPITVGQIQFPL